jgi:parallel beta-helix repeat protein
MVQFRLALALTFILCFAVFATARTCLADQSGLIYIHADGSIDPPTALISTVDNVTYTLSDDIFNNSIVIEKSNIVLDGASHTVKGTGIFGYAINDYAITLVGTSNVTVKNTTIKAFPHGIELSNSSNNTLTGNNITTSIGGVGYAISLSNSSNNIIYGDILTNNGSGGVTLSGSSGNNISRNNITNNWLGIAVLSSDSNIISGNDLTNNSQGISLDFSSNNMIFHNNFANNDTQASSLSPINVSSTNAWDNGLEGNYWSDYNGTDSNQDGIGDTPYTINADNTDHYPLMGTFQSFNVSAWNIRADLFEEVEVTSNLTISEAQLVGYFLTDRQYPWHLSLKAPVVNGSSYFCRVTFPNNMLNSSEYPVFIGPYNQISSRIIQSNGTYTTIYFSFNQTLANYNIDIVPEFPTLLLIPLLMLAASLAIMVYKRRHLT